MPKTTIKGEQIRDGEVKTADLGDLKVTEAKLVALVASTLKFQNLSVTDPKLLLRGVSTAKLATEYVRSGDIIDIGGETLLTTPTLDIETSHISVSEAESNPTLVTDGISLDGASHVTWGFADVSITSATYQGWLYTAALGWMQIPSLSGSLSDGDTLLDSLEVSGAERFALAVPSLTGTDPTLLKVLRAVTT